MINRLTIVFALLFATSLTDQILASTEPASSGSWIEEPARFSQAEFRQERHMSVLSRALVSSGRVLLSDTGFVWEQLQPFHNTLEFDGESIVERTQTSNGLIERPVRDPVSNSLTRTLFTMMQGSWGSMESIFCLRRTDSDPEMAWEVELIPLSEEVRSVIPVIQISGNLYIERIRIQQLHDDFTLIELHNQQPAQ